MRQPRQRLGDGLRILLLLRDGRQMAVELMIADEMQRRGRHIMPLLIARRHETRLRIHADERLAQSIADHLKRLPIRRHFDHRAIVLPPRRALLASFGDVKLALRPQLHRIRKLPRLRRLREEIAEHLIPVALLVPVRIHKPPDAVAVENEDLAIPRHNAHRLMQPAREAFPRHRIQIALQTGDQPHIPIKRHARRIALIIQKREVRQPHIPLPRIRHRQRDVVDDVGVRLLRERGDRRYAGAPCWSPPDRSIRTRQSRFARDAYY